MMIPLVVTIPLSPDGPAMRRRRGELPPPRRPRMNEYRIARFAGRIFNDPSEVDLRELAVGDWRAFLRQRFSLTEREEKALTDVPAEIVETIAGAVRELVSSGGALSVTLPKAKEGGQITFLKPEPSKPGRAAPSTSRTARAFTIPIINCTFDADCRNWRCRPG